jgi:broad specificity phosphatase PhoE
VQIALVRHGRPLVDAPRRIGATGLSTWIEAYDRAGIDPRLPPPPRARTLARVSDRILSSDLPRSRDSARLLAEGRPVESLRLFREAGLPALPVSGLDLPPQLWALVARVGWLLGWSRSTESAALARERAAAAAEHLCAVAERHGSVLLLGHGIINTLIARQLRAAGWRGPALPLGTYWTSAVYRRRRP